ncbi:uncharacterized protein LOC141798315 [Halichoeres trimaculatus]|uniref:uncharacterized protein LOC141798315 n=1 Tax=Halichoeres trimaculatus TaxID=147232 RepID=UPI003D9E731F
MESTGIFWMFLLFLLQLSLHPAGADLTTTQESSSESQSISSTPALGSSSSPSDHIDSFDSDTNGTRADCLIDTEMGLIALGSAGGLIACLLVATVVLAFQVWHLQRRVHTPRTSRSRSNLDLVDSAGYWGDDRPEAQGLIGPCDASVMLEEVGGDGKMEEEEESQAEVPEEVSPGPVEGAVALAAFSDPEDLKPAQMESSRDSCLEVPRDLEDMPLVV